MDNSLFKESYDIGYVYEPFCAGDPVVPEENTKLFDSINEMWFVWFCQELLSAGYLEEVWLYPVKFSLAEKTSFSYLKHLKTKTKIKSRSLVGCHVYTPDFMLVWSVKAMGIFYSPWKELFAYDPSIPFLAESFKVKGRTKTVSFVEVKAAHSRYNMDKYFFMNQKWTLQRFNVFVNLVRLSNKAKSFFDAVFTPQRFLLTDVTKNPRTLHYKPKTLSDFVESLNALKEKSL